MASDWQVERLMDRIDQLETRLQTTQSDLDRVVLCAESLIANSRTLAMDWAIERTEKVLAVIKQKGIQSCQASIAAPPNATERPTDE